MCYTKCINVIIDSIGPSIILRSIFYLNLANDSEEKCLVDVIQCIKKRTKYMVVPEIKE